VRRGKRVIRPRLVGRVVVGALTIIVILLLLTLLTRAPIFSIKNLTITGDSSGKVSAQVVSLTKGHNLLLLDTDKLRAEILKNPEVRSVTFDKTLPSSLTVRVTFRDPALAWQGTNGTYLVDDQGFIFQSGSGAGLVKVTSPDTLKIGQRVNSDALSKILVLIRLNESITTVAIQPDLYQAALPGGTTAFFDPAGNLTSQSQALQLIIVKAKIDGKLPRTVDLRFPKPVVTY